MKRSKHGASNSGNNKRKSPEYQSWSCMKARCDNPNNVDFHNYGGRGVVYAEQWQDFVEFLKDMGPRPEGYTLDRIDTNGNYEPGNCRWADNKTQQLNRRNSHGIRDRLDAAGRSRSGYYHQLRKQGFAAWCKFADKWGFAMLKYY